MTKSNAACLAVNGLRGSTRATRMTFQLLLIALAALATTSLAQQSNPSSDKVLLDPTDSIVLLLDHQTGLFQTVKDVPLPALRE